MRDTHFTMLRFAKTKTILLALAVLPTALILACGGDIAPPPTTTPPVEPTPTPMQPQSPDAEIYLWPEIFDTDFDTEINTYPPPRVTPDEPEFRCLVGYLGCSYVDDQGLIGYELLVSRATAEYCEQLALIPTAVVTCIEFADNDFRVVGKKSEWVNEFPQFPN